MMPTDEIRRRSRWMIRALEWDDTRARYPNIWREGMPCQLLVFETVGSRLRLGDLIAVYYPASQRHPQRSERFLGLGRVAGLRRAHDPSSIWVDLETAHRFDPPLDLAEAPSRVFLCADSGWPPRDVGLFRKVFEAAMAAGFKPAPLEMEDAVGAQPEGRGRTGAGASVEVAPQEGATPPPAGEEKPETEERTATEEPPRATPPPPGPAPAHHPHRTIPTPGARLFGGVDYSGDMRDPKDRTWFALLELADDRLKVVRLEATGRSGLQSMLTDSDASSMHIEAIGLDFPFGLPLPFAETILGGSFPDEGWWALVRKLERLSRPDYLVALQEFRDGHGELKRLTDEKAGAFSPLHRIDPDLGPMTYHGIRMIAEERSRYAVRPFESARGRLLLEVYPGAIARRLRLGEAGHGSGRVSAILGGLEKLERLPVEIDDAQRSRCLSRRDALDAVIAARCAAMAVLSGEVEKSPEELCPGEGDRVRKEGWIYGVGDTD